MKSFRYVFRIIVITNANFPDIPSWLTGIYRNTAYYLWIESFVGAGKVVFLSS